MDELKSKLGCLEWAIIIALVVLVVIAVLTLIGYHQPAPNFNQINNNL